MTTYNPLIDNLASRHELSSADVDAVCKELRKDLRRELQRRGLWTLTPRLLGLVEPAWNDDAMTELTHDAYVHSFVDRQRGLINQRKAGADVRGFILRNLRNFITERQKEIDPIGYTIFERTCQAIRLAIEASQVVILKAPADDKGNGAVKSSTILGFASSDAPVVPEQKLGEIVPNWSNDLFPDLITAKTNAVRRTVETLSHHIAGLRDAGVEAFCLGDLVGALKGDLRQRWQANPDDDLTVYPQDEFDGKQRLQWIFRCVTRRINCLSAGNDRTHLWKIWPFVRTCVAEDIARPAWQSISRELDISRKVVKRLYERLGEMVRQCRECLGRPLRKARSENETHSEDVHCERLAVGAGQQGR